MPLIMEKLKLDQESHLWKIKTIYSGRGAKRWVQWLPQQQVVVPCTTIVGGWTSFDDVTLMKNKDNL